MGYHIFPPLHIFLGAARFSLYAIATACLTGLPAFTSALMLCLKAFSDLDLIKGIFSSQNR